MELRLVSVLCRWSTVAVAFALFAGGARAQDTILLGPAPGGDVLQFDVSADGRWAAYVDDFVHGVRVTGVEKERRLDPRPVHDPRVLGQPLFRISPDGRRVVYGVDDDGTRRLASAPIDGSAGPVDLHAGLGEWAIAPDSSTVVLHTAPQDQDGDLVALAIDGTSPPVMIRANSRIGGFVVTADSARVVYTIRNVFGEGMLWVAPLDGSAPPLQLNTLATKADPTFSYKLLLPPGSDRLVYRRGTGQTVGDLYSVPLDGSASPIPLNDPSHYNLDWLQSSKPRFTPDGRSILYTEYPTFPPAERRLFVAPVDGSAPAVALSTALGPAGAFEREFVDSGAAVLFVHADDFDAQLYRCASDGGEAPRSLSAPVPETWYFQVPPGGTRAAFTARPFPGAPFEMWSVPIDGSEAPLRLSAPPGIDGGVMNERESFGFTQAGRIVLYATDLDGDFTEPGDVIRLWAVPIDGSAAPVRVDGATARGASVRFMTAPFRIDPTEGVYGGTLFRFAAGGKRLLYLSDQRVDDTFELFASPLPAAPAPPAARRK